MDPRDLRAYAERSWASAEARKQEHWARLAADRGPHATLRVAAALWHHMRSLRPDWPSEEERARDLAHHLALKRALDRTAGVGLAAR